MRRTNCMPVLRRLGTAALQPVPHKIILFIVTILFILFILSKKF